MSSNTEELRNKIRNTYLDYGNDLLVSGGSLDPHVDEAMQLFLQHESTLKAEYEERIREARNDEHNRWKVIAEEIVRKDGVYRAVNYLNKRAQELDQLEETTK